MVLFKCLDIGIDCSYEVTGDSQDELRGKILDHFHDNHHEGACPPEILLKIQNAINGVKSES